MNAISKLLLYLAVLSIALVLIWAGTLYGMSPLFASLLGLAVAAVGAFSVASVSRRRHLR